MATIDAIAALNERFAELQLAARPLLTRPNGTSLDQLFVRVPPERLLEVCRFLRDDPRTKFEQLCDLTCVDYLEFPDGGAAARSAGASVAGGFPTSAAGGSAASIHGGDRFGVTYSLLSLSRNHRLWLKVFVNDPDPTVPSVVGLWAGANWMEREVFDLFGITFTGHPDLRRILTPDSFTDHPLRKDYPLRGRGERERLPVVTRETA